MLGCMRNKAIAYSHPFTKRLYEQPPYLFHTVVSVASLKKKSIPRNWEVFASLACHAHFSQCHQHRSLPLNTSECASRSFVLWISLTLLTQFLTISNVTCCNCSFCWQFLFGRSPCFWSSLLFICFGRTCYKQKKVWRTNCSFLQYSDLHVAVQPII